jgi:hypothetical protein
LCRAGQALTGHPARYAQPDSEYAADLLWSHPVYDGSSDPRSAAFSLLWLGLPVATGLGWK